MNENKARTAHDEEFTRTLLEHAGSRPELAEEELATLRMAARAEWMREVSGAGNVVRMRNQVWIRRLALAASLGGLLSLGWWVSNRTIVTPERVAVVQVVSGTVSLEADGNRLPALGGEEVFTGTVLETEAGEGRASIRFASGIGMRLDVATRIRVISAQEVELTSGAVYFDSGNSNQNGFEIQTPLGVARDIGTQFAVRLLDTTRMQVRVREGQVFVRQNGSTHEAGPGIELVLFSDGRVDQRSIAKHGREWEWVLESAPAFAIEGRTLHEFLKWSSHETGWEIHFDDPGVERRAGEIVLHGTIKGSRADRVYQAVLAGAGLRGELHEGRLTIRRRGSD